MKKSDITGQTQLISTRLAPVPNGSHAHPTKDNLMIGELFSGAGGMALGASWAQYEGLGLRHVWAIDNNRDACSTFKKNIDIPKNSVICEDVENLDFVPLSPIHGLIFGFPCNDFSVIGEQRGIKGRYGGLYIYGVKALRHFKPIFFVAENVSGLTSVNRSDDFQRIVRELRDSGYDVWPRLYRFEEFEVPQRRRRVIIVGFRKDLKVKFKHPESKCDVPISVSEALASIPFDAPNHERTLQNPRVVERLKYIKPGENAFTANIPSELRLNIRSGARISQIYRRLVSDQPAYTITGSGGGGTHVYHWEENRALTNRERARLQTFPDEFVFEGSKESVRKQVGMAVPPVGAKSIFENVIRCIKLNGIALDDSSA